MSIETLHLRKLLQLLYVNPARQISLLRAEIRADLAKEEGRPIAGGDFYGPFWSDVNDHVFGRRDIRDAVEDRVESNDRRARLYPALAEGFLKWWDQERRWTNEPFSPTRAPSTVITIDDSLRIKISNILAVRDARGVDRFVYPYFSEQPSLKSEPARVGLWILKRAFVALPAEHFRVLDVLRGKIFSLDRNPLEGDEALALDRRFRNLVEVYEALRAEY